MQKVLLLYENARLTRTSLITMDNDAKSCYDRIIKTLALIACIGVGLPVMAAVMHNRTHDGMTHQIKSRHGLFRGYSGTDQDDIPDAVQRRAVSGVPAAFWTGRFHWLHIDSRFRRCFLSRGFPRYFSG